MGHCGEIEAVLRAHRDVRQAVVVTATRGDEPALVAYVVPRRGSATARPGADLLEELLPHLRAALPDYMIPALVIPLPALPLTPNAKVDRAALPAPQWGPSPSSAGHVPPRSPVEETLARIWGDLLATQAPIDVRDNLFALGGHSLTARPVDLVIRTHEKHAKDSESWLTITHPLRNRAANAIDDLTKPPEFLGQVSLPGMEV